jgi:hypothetical protein
MTLDQVDQIIGYSHLPQNNPQETKPGQSIYSYRWVSEESYQWISVTIDDYGKKVVCCFLFSFDEEPSFKSMGSL